MNSRDSHNMGCGIKNEMLRVYDMNAIFQDEVIAQWSKTNSF